MGFFDQDDIIQILKIVGESKIDELHLEMGDLKLITKKTSAAKIEEREPIPERPSEVAVQQEAETQEATPVPTAKIEEMQPVSEAEGEGLTPIKASLLGTFYRAPKPGAPPFVEEGQAVTEDDTVCIIEVMKLFNTTKAGVRGYIRKICAEDGQLVEFNQILFLVEEAADEEMSGEERV